jgi:hypothetical protein
MFEVGSVVTPAGEYYDKFLGIPKQVEDQLDLARPPHKSPRQACTFVFLELRDAEKHWRMMKDGKLYKVSIDNHQIVHIGDMHIMDLMKSAAERGEPIAEMADQYWSDFRTEKPIIEILVPSAQVIEVICSEEGQRKAAFMSYYGIRGAGPSTLDEA